MIKVVLRRGREAKVRGGHPWVFAGDLIGLPPDEIAGEAVELIDHRGKFLAVATCNPRSALTLRVLSRQREDIDRAWIRRKLEAALVLREAFLPGVDAMRLVNAESDGLPALIVDRFGEFLVIQSLSQGADRMLPFVVQDLVEMVRPRGIYERSDVPVRSLEGLEGRTGVLFGEEPPAELIITEGASKFAVDLRGGQKTGFFLDQRANRQRLIGLCKDRRVLNAFCYSGGFSIPAALGGASEVQGVDISGGAIALAERNAELNGVEDRCRWVEANAFDHLRDLDRLGEKFDVVILDPPAFTKNKDSIPGAIRGYKEINLRAIKILNPGGLLITSSCSHHMDPELFLNIIADSASDANRPVRMVDYTGPGPDHPSLPAAPETRYLKCFWGVVG